MKSLIRFLIIAGFTLAESGWAGPASLVGYPIGVQWAGTGPVISERCGAPNMGGHNCLRFPQGARLWALSWQSSVKQQPHEVLLILRIAPMGSSVNEPGSQHVLATHHKNVPVIVKDLTWPAPLLVPAGWVVWIYADGAVAPGEVAPVEVQATLYGEEAPTEVR